MHMYFIPSLDALRIFVIVFWRLRLEFFTVFLPLVLKLYLLIVPLCFDLRVMTKLSGVDHVHCVK